MNNISCNVIRDLLPSYMDKIASDDSVKLVEEHLTECTECMDFKNRMEKPDLQIADNDVGLDYMKKIRRLTDLKTAVCFFLVLIAGLLYLKYTKDLHYPNTFFILAAVMLISNYLLFFHRKEPKTVKRAKAMIPNIVGIFFVLYIIVLFELSFYNWIHDKRAPFYIDYGKLGPFLSKQLVFIMAFEIIIWIKELVLHIQKAHFSVISSSFAIIGFYMALYYDGMLHNITTLDTFSVINRNALLLFAEGIGILLVLFIIEKVKNKGQT